MGRSSLAPAWEPQKFLSHRQPTFYTRTSPMMYVVQQIAFHVWRHRCDALVGTYRRTADPCA